jgi:peptide/nickel transport system substrate-binding protein
MNRFLACTALAAGALLISSSALLAQSQNMRVAIPGVPPGLGNPMTSGVYSSPNIFFYLAMYDPLTLVNEDGSTRPSLALSWRNVDKDTWQFTLRPNVTFSNGRPVDAEAVVRNINFLSTDYAKGQNVGTAVPMADTARSTGPMTVEFEKEVGNLPMIDHLAWSELGPDGFARTPVGTGSYRLASATTNWASKVIPFVPHTGSWRPGKVAQVTLTEIPERTARVQALESSQIEIAIGLNMDAWDQLERAGHVVYTAPAPVVYAIPLISTRPTSPFKDVRVRQAVNYALDKDTMNKGLLRGRATPASQPATPNTYGYNPDVKPYPYDPQKARQLLTEAGFPNGFKTKLEGVMGGSQTADTEIYLQVGNDLKRVGVDVDVQAVPFSDWIRKWIPGPGATELGFPDMFGLGYFLTPELDAVRGYITHWCDKTPRWYCNESLRPLVDQARSEFDPDKRKKVLQELMRLGHEDAPVLYMVNQIDVAAYNRRVQNFKMINRYINYDEITLR